MLVNLIEFGARESLLALIEEINRNKTLAWGLVLIKRDPLKNMSNELFVRDLKPLVQDAREARVFVMENGDFYVAWLGMQKRIYGQLCMAVDQWLRPSEKIEPGSVIIYFDPQVMGNEIAALLKAGIKEPEMSRPKETLLESWRALIHENALQPSAHDLETFLEAARHRPERKQLEIMVVEDQQLLRRLLHEILRTEYTVTSVATMQEGWKHYLEHAPNIVFLDIGLTDGNGHDLAKAIKHVDPSSCVVMVTANNTPEELEIARENHVNGFVGKPYSKQQITKCISKYITDHRLSSARHQSA